MLRPVSADVSQLSAIFQPTSTVFRRYRPLSAEAA
jgi:hypothetical protein